MLIVKVSAINALGKTKGCEKAPVEVIKALDEIWTNEQGKKIEAKGLDYEEIHIDNSNIAEANKLIFENALEIFHQQDRTIFLGGDHSISYSLCRAFLRYEKSQDENPGLIVFDAHPDCMPSNKEPTHEEWLHALIKEGFPSQNIILIGIRNADETEQKFIQNKKINIFSAKEIFSDIHESADAITEAARKFSSLYISIDIDAVDPSSAPGTGYIEPAGLSSREFLYILQRLMMLKNFKAADIVEINPAKDINNLTVKLGAKILAELI